MSDSIIEIRKSVEITMDDQALMRAITAYAADRLADADKADHRTLWTVSLKDKDNQPVSLGGMIAVVTLCTRIDP